MKKTAFTPPLAGLDLQNLVKTKDDIAVLNSEINLILSALFTSHKKIEKVLTKEIRLTTYAALKKDFLDKEVSPSKIKELLNELSERLKKLKVLELTLAFEPTQEEIFNIYNWVKENLGDDVILDIKLDKSILGGAIIVFEGLYKDYTVKKQLEEVFEKKREEIINLVK